MTIDSGDPITQTSERTSKSTKSPFRTLNATDPSSISIELIALPSNARSSIAVTGAGIQSPLKDEQPQNGRPLIVQTLDDGSKTTDRKRRQCAKHRGGSSPTEDGIAMDRNKAQEENALNPISQR
jgi:hypothetical protein